MRLLDLAAIGPDDLAAVPSLYILGVNGPLDEAGIGRVESFVWRFAILDGPTPTVLAFSDIRALMAFTRAVNGREAFSAPTESVKLTLGPRHVGLPVRLAVDLSAEAFWSLAEGRRLTERPIPELEF